MKLRNLLITLPVIIVVVALALANRRPVVLSFDPFNTATAGNGVEVPLFIALFGALIIGILIGGTVAWGAGLKRRRVLKRRVKIVERDLATAQKTAPAEAAPAPGTAITVHGGAGLATAPAAAPLPATQVPATLP
ncbi:lipopolysaccharide assembly protein LapA domain-containing protein [Zavarzinia compransoris]|uniref:lipopolysaccharide assembly protein LapA domain-containing protein n=1 Tax=Zavarzinia marina TaxID=2911065 RepID=UPI001F2E874F|nr:lipopolysaccharide assembly protein LapA domain-containing protein [Zavarzinia marina]MCF4166079.1 lipopolysaccharide assembly protein LapA domain-containing protein [Zavarzinia marina]